MSRPLRHLLWEMLNGESTEMSSRQFKWSNWTDKIYQELFITTNEIRKETKLKSAHKPQAWLIKIPISQVFDAGLNSLRHICWRRLDKRLSQNIADEIHCHLGSVAMWQHLRDLASSRAVNWTTYHCEKINSDQNGFGVLVINQDDRNSVRISISHDLHSSRRRKMAANMLIRTWPFSHHAPPTFSIQSPCQIGSGMINYSERKNVKLIFFRAFWAEGCEEQWKITRFVFAFFRERALLMWHFTMSSCAAATVSEDAPDRIPQIIINALI